MENKFEVKGGRRGGKMMEFNAANFKWNGQSVFRVKLVSYEVCAPDGEQQISDKSWIWPFIGRIRQGIVIQAAHGDPFMIDNEDGQGYLKLANGGKVNQGHKPAVGKVIEGLEWSECITTFRPDVYRESIELNLEKMNSTEREAAEKILIWLDDYEDKDKEVESKESSPQVMAPPKKIKQRFIKRHLYNEKLKQKNRG